MCCDWSLQFYFERNFCFKILWYSFYTILVLNMLFILYDISSFTDFVLHWFTVKKEFSILSFVLNFLFIVICMLKWAIIFNEHYKYLFVYHVYQKKCNAWRKSYFLCHNTSDILYIYEKNFVSIKYIKINFTLNSVITKILIHDAVGYDYILFSFF